MPSYCYTNDHGTETRVFPITTVPKSITIGGEKAHRDFVAEHTPNKRRVQYGTWPMFCDASGCAPSQVQEFRDDSVKLGVPTDFLPDGRSILRNPQHYQDYHEAVGLYSRNCYGVRGDARRGKSNGQE